MLQNVLTNIYLYYTKKNLCTRRNPDNSGAFNQLAILLERLGQNR